MTPYPEHIYFVVERQNIGAGNWTALIALFESMGLHGSDFPAFNNHWRTRLDGDAVIYESMFRASEITMEAFKQLLADTFGVDVEDISTTQDSASYSPGGTTTTWQFIYAAVDRFLIERFGGGGATWEQSRQEALGYLKLNSAQWEEDA